MNTTRSITLSLTITALGIAPQLMHAQPAVSKPVTKQVVSPRALITQVEIAEYRRAVKTAPNHETKMAIREATYAKLRQRAVERGMVMSEPQPWFGGLHWGEVAPLQAQRKVEVKPAVPEAKPVVLQSVAPVQAKTAVVPPQVAKPTAPQQAKSVAPHQVKPASPHPTKPILTHHSIPISLPHPMKPVLPRIIH